MKTKASSTRRTGGTGGTIQEGRGECCTARQGGIATAIESDVSVLVLPKRGRPDSDRTRARFGGPVPLFSGSSDLLFLLSSLWFCFHSRRAYRLTPSAAPYGGQIGPCRVRLLPAGRLSKSGN